MIIIRLLIFILCCTCFPIFADTPFINAWTKPNSGNWDDPSAWSLGVLPSSSQSVLITNSGWKAVAVNPSTPVNFPSSMTVSNLTIRGASDTRNLLLLNYFGTALPLTVLNGLTLQDNAQIVNFNSGLVVQGGTITVTNAQIIQNLGYVRTTNATMYLQNAEYDLTNGVFEGGTVVLGWPVSARFNQYGGAVSISALDFAEGAGAGGTYALYGGYLSLPGGLSLVGGDGAYSSYFQAGGTNQTTSVYLEPNMYGGSPSFTLNEGLLADTAFSIVADDYGSVTVDQNGGTHIITNTLSMSGGFTHGQTIRPGTYNLNAGTLSVGGIDLNGYPGDALFVQSSGIATAGTISAHSAGYFASCNTHITLAGGTLSCSNLTTDDGHGTLDQSGGALLVSNLLDLRGFRDLGQGFTYYFRYTFTGGTLAASNINLSGDWIIGDSTGANRITNSGTCTLSHTIQIGNAVEQLGRFILAGTNATIDLAGSTSRLSFADSSDQAWAGGATLAISNWNGNLTGGGAEQLRFGTSASGLTSAQLNQILFNNPAGLPAGTYPAKMLSTGEIVPNNSVTPPPGLVNNWINPSSDKWEHASSWSLGALPASNQTVNITNAGYKAVNMDTATVSGFPNSLTVSNLMIGGTPNSQNLLLLNYAGTTTPLQVLNNLNIETNGRVLMLSSGINVSNALHVGGVFDQQGGEFTFTNSPATTMQVEGGSFNLTNGFVAGVNMYLGGTNDGYVNEDSGLVSLASLGLGSKLYYLNGHTGTYLLQSGWLIVSGEEDVGQSGPGSLTQNGGTNSATELSVSYGTYVKNGGSLFAGEVLLDPPSGPLPPDATMTHAGGSAVITNDLHLFSPGSGPHPGVATFNMAGGSLSAQSILMEDASIINQSSGTVNVAAQLLLNGSGDEFDYAAYYQSGGSLCTSNIILEFQGSFGQTGGTLTVTNTVSISSSGAAYQLRAGTVTARNFVLAGNLGNDPPQIFVYQAPPFAITNESISLGGGAIVIQDSAQQFGRLSLQSDSGISFAGNSAVLRFADSHTTAWQSGQLTVYNWNGSANGGGADQLVFGTSNSALTAGQVAQIHFVNPAGFPSGTYPVKILSTGEIVPSSAVQGPTLTVARTPNGLVLTWPSGFQLLSATNVAGPYAPVAGASSPWTIHFTSPQQFFRLQGM